MMNTAKATIKIPFTCNGVHYPEGTEVTVLCFVGSSLFRIELPNGETCRVGRSRLNLA